MSLPPFPRILATIALCLAAAGLSSCIYSDLGRAVGSIGTEVPRLVPKANRGIMSSYCGNLYRKNGRYYVALPLAWVPERRRGYEIMLPFTPPGTSVFNTSHTYNRPYTAEELQQYPTKPEYYEAVNPSIVHFPQADANGAIGYVRADLTPAAEFNPEGAESIGLYGVAGAAHRIGHLEKRHAWYHYPLKPLQAVAAVADVPLSAALMPISFALLSMAMEVTGGDWQTIRPWHDNTRLTYDGPLYPEYDTGISPPETMAGKRLVLGGQRFDFLRDEVGDCTHRGKKYSCRYSAPYSARRPLAKLSENSSGPRRSREWQLLFITPNSGVAVSRAKDYNSQNWIYPPPHTAGDLVYLPFRIENLPAQRAARLEQNRGN